ncbi:aminotransferase class I/II-fold pyridoxal phosphate-dependent enzyme [Candidatus Peregrinibacteria bacterium]|nr:aminotransferase class I/II-fold pyridoxal phosphate-dependent enzyme [Candidatus Peregrinibacteria bacterium]
MTFDALNKTSIWNAFSSLGRDIYLPQGIFYWSGRAKAEAEINGTAGVAQDDDGTISHLAVAEQFAGQKIMERVPKANIFGYAPIEGLASLRQKWFAKLSREHPSLAQFSSMPVTTNGITHSIALASHLLLDKGQIVITADKSWENYEHILTRVQGAKLETFPLFTSDFKFNIDKLIAKCREVAAKQNKVILLLNFPHNQTGFMPSPEECKNLGAEIQNLCKEMRDVPFIVLLDDAYEGYVYDDKAQKVSPASEIFANLPNLTVVKMDGISKVMLAYGYRVGFLTFFVNSLDGQLFSDACLKGIRDELTNKVGAFIRGEISQVNHHGQIFADVLMDNYSEVCTQRAQIISRLKERWEVLMKGFNENYKKYGKERMQMDPCNGGFFCYVNLADGIDPKQIAEKLIKDKKIGIVPSGQGMRVAFCGVAKDKIPRMVEAIFETVY